MFRKTTHTNGHKRPDETDRRSTNVISVADAAAWMEIIESLNSDIFFFSGPIERGPVYSFLELAESIPPKDNVGLILCTHGGDADAAYIIARFLKSRYKRFTLYVFGHCKSAGTLIALGADEIVMSSRGELGPLDVQLLKADDLFFRGSGLDIDEAIKSLSDQAFSVFENHFLGIIKRGAGSITTKTAADIASKLASSLIAPITAQIDPLHVGEVERAINIAYQYGIRLNGDETRINRLVSEYPSHSFVIDFMEAKEIFGNVRELSEAETNMERFLQEIQDDQGRRLIRSPSTIGMMAYFDPRKEAENGEESSETLSTDKEVFTGPEVKNLGSNGNCSGKSGEKHITTTKQEEQAV